MVTQGLGTWAHSAGMVVIWFVADNVPKIRTPSTIDESVKEIITVLRCPLAWGIRPSVGVSSGSGDEAFALNRTTMKVIRPRTTTPTMIASVVKVLNN